MHHFTIIVSTQRPLDGGTELERIRPNLPFVDAITAECHGLSADGRVLYYFASNEPGASLPERSNSRTVLATGDPPSDVGRAALRPTDELHRQIGRLPGRFSAAVIDLATSTVAAATPLARLDPIYYALGGSRHIVSTWSATAAACRNEGARPRARDEIASFLSAGHFFCDATFHDGVIAMPPYATLIVTSAQARGRCDFFDHTLNQADPSASYYDDVADAFTRACQRVARGRESVTLDLSGGKDSRLLLAGFVAAGATVDAVTTSGGGSNSADVHCATAAARLVGVKHTVRQLGSSTARAEGTERIDLYKRTIDILRATDCQIISWGNMAYRPRNSGQLVLNGLGGELLRGGYGKTRADTVEGRTPFDFLLSRGMRNARYLTSAAQSAYRAYLRDWLGEFPRPITVTEAADLGYLYFRLGRWASAQTRAGMLARRPTYPLLDNAFLTLVYSAPATSRANDRLLYHILARLDRRLADAPFANDTWRFQGSDEIEAIKAAHPEAFVARGDGSAANFDWRRNWTALLPEFRRQILARDSVDALAPVLNVESVRELLDGNSVTNAHRFILFAVYAASLVLTGAVEAPDDIGIQIEVPLN